MDSSLLLKIGRDIASEAAQAIQSSAVQLGRYTGIIGKSGDRTKRGDWLVEEALRQIVPRVLQQSRCPGAVIICEETGYWTVGDPAASEAIFLIIDPVDGSNNLRPHPTPRPFVAFSIALGLLAAARQPGNFAAVSAGVIRDIFHDEEYYASRGGGAWLNGARLHSSPVTELAEAFIGMSLDRSGERLQTMLQAGLLDLLLQTSRQRRLGLSTLDLCRVASGDYDAQVSLSGDAKVHDLAAARLIVEEAGGCLLLGRNNQPVNDDQVLAQVLSPGSNLSAVGFQFLASGNEALLAKLRAILGW
ncbi:MAG: hypothetical protein HYV42_01780 [Candidatus Magasanikbacteria bacterium]|nr:hypothetical protein [Candidatus Magasanikbacteria bacterium]